MRTDQFICLRAWNYCQEGTNTSQLLLEPPGRHLQQGTEPQLLVSHGSNVAPVPCYSQDQPRKACQNPGSLFSEIVLKVEDSNLEKWV